jgi:serine/threonine-protein kinase
MGQAVTAAADQYAFGVMAFEILTGDLPFKGTVQEVLIAHMETPPPSLRERRPEISPAIEALVHRMLAKQPVDRFPSLREAERAFRALVPDEGGTTQIIAGYSHVQAATASAVIAAPTVPHAPTLRSPVSQSAPSQPPTSQPPRSSRRNFIAAAAALIVLIAAGALVARSRAGQTAAPVAVAASQPAPIAAPPATDPAVVTTPVQKSSAPNSAPVPANKPAADNSVATKTDAVAPAPVPPAPARVDSSPSRLAPAASPPADPAPAADKPAAAIADARKLARDFVTMLNQQRYRELAQIPARGGDPAQRAELIRLVQNSQDFAAGFDRVASAPDRTPDGFVTDFVLDLEWKGGHKLLLVQAYATMQNGSWHLAGLGVEAPR